MSSEDLNIDQFICFKEKPLEEDKFFNRERTLKLLELYKLYKKKLGTFEVKSLKRLWEFVARDLSNEYRTTISPSKCENRFKVLERNYKKVVDNNKKTGRGLKVFEFEKEMDEIFGRRRNVNPVILLSSEDNSEKESQSCILHEEIETMHHSEQGMEANEKEGNLITILDNCTPKRNLKRRRTASPAYHKRNDILVEIKNDLKRFYERIDKRQEEKLSIEKKKLEERQKKTEIVKEYLDFMKGKGSNAPTCASESALQQ